MKNSQAIDLALRIVALHEVAAPADTIIAAVQFALDECAARERARCATLIRSSEPELWAAGSDQSFIAGYKAALSGLLAAIRALD